jgi:hypothetical protein
MPPPVNAAQKLKIDQYAGELPYASEIFGVYQPLLGWKSARRKMKLSVGLAERVRLDRPNARLQDEVQGEHSVELTASLKLDREEPFSVRAIVPNARLQHLLTEQRHVATEHFSQRTHDTARTEERKAILTPYKFIEEQLKLEHSQMNEILSPVGILHLFREYFFELATFLGTPVGHVWVSPGGTVELYEVSTRKTTTERTTEYATERSSKTESTSTQQDEIADAVRQENTQDQKLGVTATGSAGIGVVQASGSASFSLENTRKQSQEATHKRMREQTQKYSTELRETFKTTFRTVTETTDTSSRRYVLSNTTKELVSYELRRKMRRVAVQVQHLGDQLCWQLFLDNPGKALGIAEYLPPIPPEAMPTQDKGPDLIPAPGPVFVPARYHIDSPVVGEPEGPTSLGKSWRGFQSYNAPAPPQGYQLQGVTAKALPGPASYYELTFQPIDPVGNRFTPDSQNWNWYSTGLNRVEFDMTFEYRPTDAYIQFVETTNASTKAAYQLALGKKDYVAALLGHLKNFGKIDQRNPDDLRKEERAVVVKRVMEEVFHNFGDPLTWGDSDWHIVAEFAHRLFDLDRLLYFVSPEWFRKSPIAPFDNTQNARSKTKIDLNDTMDWGCFQLANSDEPFPGYLVTEDTVPAPMGASLGWLIQLDADERRNAFLNSPWVKIVIPIRRFCEKEALAWLSSTDVEGSDGLGVNYKVQPGDPPEWAGETLQQVLIEMAAEMNKQYEAASTPTALDFAGSADSRKILPTEKVFEHGFDPLEGGLALGAKPYKVFSQWTEILPTDQVVAVPYKTP